MFFIEKTIVELISQFDSMPIGRKSILKDIARFIENETANNRSADLIFICTHNSRRSHIAQIWSETAAAWYKIPNVRSYSGGTEATAFNPRAVEAMKELGFNIKKLKEESNPHYLISYSDDSSFEVFSKKYDDPHNPARGFAAIMTCTHADENCPIVFGAAARFSLPFDDPKDFDGTHLESVKYRERSIEIGREILYLFSQIRKP